MYNSISKDATVPEAVTAHRGQGGLTTLTTHDPNTEISRVFFSLLLHVMQTSRVSE